MLNDWGISSVGDISNICNISSVWDISNISRFNYIRKIIDYDNFTPFPILEVLLTFSLLCCVIIVDIDTLIYNINRLEKNNYDIKKNTKWVMYITYNLVVVVVSHSKVELSMILSKNKRFTLMRKVKMI